MNAQDKRTLVFLTKDSDLSGGCADLLVGTGLSVRVHPSLESLVRSGASSSDSLLVLDTRVLAEGQRICDLLEELHVRIGWRPTLICVAHSNDLELRLQALRAGAKAYFVTPVPTDLLVERALSVAGMEGSRPHRVLVVDDQPVAALFAARVLEDAGMETRTLGDALAVLDALTDFRPDLALMDLHMPGADGIELTSIIRDHDELFELPVVFLSRELDAGVQLEALRVGGDDFLAKPVRPERLVAVVRDRILAAQSHRGRASAQRDPVTGLLNRPAFLRRLAGVFGDRALQSPGSALLFIKLQIPDSAPGKERARGWGVLFEDVGREIRGRMQPGEIAGRCGEAEWALVARRADPDALAGLASELRSAFGRLARASDLGVRAAIGIAPFLRASADSLTLLSRSQKAAAEAGAAGGEMISTYRPTVSVGSTTEGDDQLVTLVEEALLTGGLALFFQPILSLRRTSGERYEATLRLISRGGEHMPASAFLPAAERGGLMTRIDNWVLRRGLDLLQRERENHPGLRLFLHQTPATIAADDWTSWLRDQILTRDLVKRRPILQFRLEDVAANPALAADRFTELRRLGIRLCLTQFKDDATAHRLVNDLPISFVRLVSGWDKAPAVAGLKDLVRRLRKQGCSVIGAGIESPQALARCWQSGAHFVQGGFLQMPAPELTFDFTETELVGDARALQATRVPP